MKIVLIGSGNVGHHLGRQLHKIGENILQVTSRTANKAKKLANALHAEPVSDWSDLTDQADLYIIAAKDDAIAEIAGILAGRGCGGRLVVHTSGATPIRVFEGTGLHRYGVLYPLQTFSATRKANFKKIPFCVDANLGPDLEILKELAGKMSPHVHHLSSLQMARLHLAAVFANNFTNHLYHVANEILQKENVPFHLLLPLIEETWKKVLNNDPKHMQTGPAIRNDTKTIERHLGMMEPDSDEFQIYQLLTKAIQTAHFLR